VEGFLHSPLSLGFGRSGSPSLPWWQEARRQSGCNGIPSSTRAQLYERR
jgi:hypothetical protein